MKKTLIALAVAGVVAAPAAMADVTVYGQANVSVSQSNDGKDGYLAVNSNSSRFGIKAAESLDGGLTAVAQMEFGVAMDSNGTSTTAAGDKVAGPNITARNQFVGLAGGFGTILAGRHDAPIKMSTGALDVFADTIGDYNSIVGVNGAADVRADNAIAYVAPAIAGATIVLAYVPDEVAKSGGKSVSSDATSAAVMWGQGPLSVDFGYLATGKDFQVQNTAGGAVAKDLPTTLADLAGGGATAADITAEITVMRFGVGYAVNDALKVAAIYETMEAKNSALNGIIGTSKIKANDWLINAAYNIGGGNTVKAEYGVVENKTTGFKKDNGALMAVGLDHAFSKNTSAYVVYASMANDKAGSWRLGAVGPGQSIKPNAAGKDPNSLEVGMVVKF